MKQIMWLFAAMMLVNSCADKGDVFIPSTGGTSGVDKDYVRPTGENVWAIDMTPLEIGDKCYAVWSGWRAMDGVETHPDGQILYISEMTFHDKYPKVRLGNRVELSTYNDYPAWENVAKHKILEGPQILRNPKNDDVFIIYSCNGSWTSQYRLGQLKLKKGADPLDPNSWVKKDKAVFVGASASQQKNDPTKVSGVGHASFTTSPDGTETWIYYHAKTSHLNGWDDRRAFLKKIEFDGTTGDPVMGSPLPNPNTMDRPSGEIALDANYGITSPESTFMNPTSYEAHADPWITKHDGKYYTIRTGDGKFWVTESPYMTKFVKNNKIDSWMSARVDAGWRPATEASGRWNVRQIWAPELHYVEAAGKWCVFYAAGKETEAPFDNQRAGVLISTTNSVYGPYIEHDNLPLYTGDNAENK